MFEPAAGQAPQGKEPKAKEPAVKLGLSINDPKAFQGYTLLAPLKGTKTVRKVLNNGVIVLERRGERR